MHWSTLLDLTKFLTTELNEAQSAAVTHDCGPLLVVAGAGSGKTRVITARIAYLIAHRQVPAHSIVALTFTNKAANEMKERIKHFIGTGQTLPFVGTFHSYCLLLLKKYTSLDTFSILDTDDQEKMIKGLLQRSAHGAKVNPKTVLYQISQFKNSLSDNAEFFFNHPLIFEIYTGYETEKRASRTFDFDDLLLQALNLFKTNSSFKAQFQNTVRHLLIDEYQDTNLVQHALLMQMAKHESALSIDSVCAVGDEDQSIYSWRGATVANMLNFTKDFAETTTVVKIEQNYRSVTPILDLANDLIKHNKTRSPKTLRSDKHAVNATTLLSFASEYQESDAVAAAIKIFQTHTPKNSCAVLYRTHTQSRAIEEALIKNNIPYKIIGGIQFYERKEIKDLLAYLRFIVNPFDRIALLRIINTPARGLGPKFQETIQDIWRNEPFLSGFDIITRLRNEESPASTKYTHLQNFLQIFDNLHAQSTTSTALETVLIRSQYRAYLHQTCPEQEAKERMENIHELISAVGHFEAQGTATLQIFLEEIALLQDKTAQSTSDKPPVIIMTLHAAKGLEFHAVFLIGLEETIIPTSRATANDEDIEEERRLLYVGITRARHKLVLSYAKNRYVYGQLMKQTPSRFIQELPNKVISPLDATFWNRYQCVAYFTEWFTGSVPRAPQVMTFAQPARAANPLDAAKKHPLLAQAVEKQKGSSSACWYKNQRVVHQKYGVGTVELIEKANDQKIFLTIRFPLASKKILADFVKPVS